VHRPTASLWPDADRAADLLMRACLAQLARWNVRVRYADGALPAPLVHGLPRNWPHIRAVCERAGFQHVGDTEVILIARVADLPAHEPRPGVTAERTLGECGTRFTAHADGRALGFVEVDTALARPERHARAAGLADVGNLRVDPAHSAPAWNTGSWPRPPTGSACAASTGSSPTKPPTTAPCSTSWRVRAFAS
jgi:hypothetical protein